MLVLTRKVGDVIAIGDNIKIVVMAIKGKQVRLGVQADRNTIVHREEVYQKIQRETRAAMTSDLSKATAAEDLLKSATASNGASESGAKKSGVVRTPASKPMHIIRRSSSNAPVESDSFDDEDDDSDDMDDEDFEDEKPKKTKK